MNTKTRQITEGAMIIAIEAVFLLLDKYLGGLISAYVFWALPLFNVVYAARHGYRAGAVVWVSVTLLSFIITGDLYGVVLVAITNLTGMVYGGGVKEGRSNAWLFGSALLTTIVNYALTSVIIPIMYGIDIFEETRMIADAIAQSIPQMDVSRMYDMVKEFTIASIMLAAVLEAVIVHILAHVLLKRLKVPVAPLKDMQMIRIPKWLGWAMLAVIVLAVANTRFKWAPALDTYLTLLSIICQFAFIAFGYMEVLMLARISGRKQLSLAAVILVFLMPTLLMVFGILDVVTDYRERLTERYANGQKQ